MPVLQWQEAKTKGMGTGQEPGVRVRGQGMQRKVLARLWEIPGWGKSSDFQHFPGICWACSSGMFPFLCLLSVVPSHGAPIGAFPF